MLESAEQDSPQIGRDPGIMTHRPGSSTPPQRPPTSGSLHSGPQAVPRPLDPGHFIGAARQYSSRRVGAARRPLLATFSKRDSSNRLLDGSLREGCTTLAPGPKTLRPTPLPSTSLTVSPLPFDLGPPPGDGWGSLRLDARRTPSPGRRPRPPQHPSDLGPLLPEARPTPPTLSLPPRPQRTQPLESPHPGSCPRPRANGE